MKRQGYMKNQAFLTMIALMTLVLLLAGCMQQNKDRHPAQDQLSAILSGIADSHSLILFNNIQADVKFLFEEYQYGQLVHSEELGQIKINAINNSSQASIITAVVSDLENGREYISFLYSSGGTTQKKRISRQLPKNVSVAYKGMQEEFSGTLLNNEYILSVSSYSSAPTNTGIIADKLTQLERYENIHLIKMRVL